MVELEDHATFLASNTYNNRWEFRVKYQLTNLPIKTNLVSHL